MGKINNFPIKAFEIICDERNNPPEYFDKGILNMQFVLNDARDSTKIFNIDKSKEATELLEIYNIKRNKITNYFYNLLKEDIKNRISHWNFKYINISFFSGLVDLILPDSFIQLKRNLEDTNSNKNLLQDKFNEFNFIDYHKHEFNRPQGKPSGFRSSDSH